jgi:hypothetical protein
VILSMQGVSLAGADGYQAASKALAALHDGEALRMTVLRAGRTIDLEIPLKRSRRQWSHASQVGGPRVPPEGARP